MKATEYQYDSKVSAIHRLRVNVASLVAESRIIRKETKRAGDCYRFQLDSHRRTVVRQELRYANLALAFVRGRAYRNVERNAKAMPDAKRIREKLSRFGISVATLDKWIA